MPPHSVVGARLADTHCHVQLQAFDEDRDRVMSEALSSLAWVVVVGDDVESSRRALALTGPRVHATAGVHPHNASRLDAHALHELRDLARDGRFVAIGEIGLDYHYEFSPRDIQQAALRSQLLLAVELDLPVVIHCREAESDFLQVIAQLDRCPAGVMHCFSGNAEFAQQCLDLGFDLSFAGNVTFLKAHPIREAASKAPLDRIMVETDSPYLAPQKVRGKRCEPVHVAMTAQFLAELKGVSLETFAAATTANGERLFLNRAR